jgi:hypothetical protein
VNILDGARKHMAPQAAACVGIRKSKCSALICNMLAPHFRSDLVKILETKVIV